MEQVATADMREWPPRPRLKEGMIVAYSICVDTIARLFDDAQLVRDRLEALKLRKYVGIVRTSTIHPQEDVSSPWEEDESPPMEKTEIRFIGDRLPEQGRLRITGAYVDETQLCAPLVEASLPGLIPGRAPLKVDRDSFPFTGAIVDTQLAARVAVSKIHDSADELGGWKLTSGAIKLFHEYVDADDDVVATAEADPPEQPRETQLAARSDDESLDALAKIRAVPEFDTFVQVWHNFDAKQVCLDPSVFKREEVIVREVIADCLDELENGSIRKWVDSIEGEPPKELFEGHRLDSGRSEGFIFSLGLGLGILIGLGWGAFAGLAVAKWKR